MERKMVDGQNDEIDGWMDDKEAGDKKMSDPKNDLVEVSTVGHYIQMK